MRFADSNARRLFSALLILLGAFVALYLITSRREAAVSPLLDSLPEPLSAECELCKKPLAAGKEVVVQTEERHHLYRCVHCALNAMMKMREAQANLLSGLERKTLIITKKRGNLRVEPSSAVFLILPEAAGDCLDRHLAFAEEAEFSRYLENHPELKALSPKRFTIADLEEMLPAGRPPGSR